VKPSNYEISKLTMKILYLGLLINVGGATLLFFLGLLLEQKGLAGSVPIEQLQTLGYVLLAVSLLELIVIFVLKRKWLISTNSMFTGARSLKKISSQIKILYITLYFVALGPAIYGFLFFMLGGSMDLFVLMICITLMGYMLIRPKMSFIEKIMEPFEFDDL
jgi:hypothetical protein